MDEAIGVVNLAQAAISRTAIDMMNKGPQQELALPETLGSPDGAQAQSVGIGNVLRIVEI
jgi:hypothetical protein